MTLAPFGSYHSSLQASWHVGNVVAHLMKLCNTTGEQGDTEQQASAPVVFQTLEARQSHISNQNGATSRFEIRLCPNTNVSGANLSGANTVSNPA